MLLSERLTTEVLLTQPLAAPRLLVQPPRAARPARPHGVLLLQDLGRAAAGHQPGATVCYSVECYLLRMRTPGLGRDVGGLQVDQQEQPRQQQQHGLPGVASLRVGRHASGHNNSQQLGRNVMHHVESKIESSLSRS